MTYYFIDYENVHADGFRGAANLKNGDIICVLYTDQSRNVTFDVIEEINRHGAVIESHRAGTGSKNALDFQLSSLLGYTIGTHPGEEYHYVIVSEDTGYNPVVEFWRGRGVDISRFSDLSGRVKGPAAETKRAAAQQDGRKGAADVKKPSDAKKGAQAAAEPKQEPKKAAGQQEQPKSTGRRRGRRSKVAEENLATREELIACLGEDEYNEAVLEIINSYKTKQAINNALTKEYKDTKKGGAIYKKLKTLLKEKKKS